MKVKCKGFEGELTYLTISSTLRSSLGEYFNIYSIELKIDRNITVRIDNVKEGEIEVINNEQY